MIKYLNEVYEVFKRSVQMGLFSQRNNLSEKKKKIKIVPFPVKITLNEKIRFVFLAFLYTTLT